MERLDTDVGSMKPALQEAPKILKSVGVDSAFSVAGSVVDDLVRVLPFQSFIRKQLIGIERRASLDPLLDFLLERFLFPILDYHRLDFPAALHESDHGGFVLSASASDAPL